MRGFVTLAFVLAVFPLALSSPAAGRTRWFVAANGTDSSTCGGKKEPCRTITAAMADALDGDTVEGVRGAMET